MRISPATRMQWAKVGCILAGLVFGYICGATVVWKQSRVEIRRSLPGNIRILLRQPLRERVRVEDFLPHLEVKSMTTVLIRFPFGLNEIWLVH